MNQKEKNSAVILFTRSESLNDENTIYQRLCQSAHARNFTIAGSFAICREEFFDGLLHALDVCSKNKANYLLIDSILSIRLSYKELFAALEHLIKHKISLVIDEILLEPTMLLLCSSVLSSAAAIEKEQHSTRIKNSLQHRSLQGQRLGGRKYGSKPEEARIIRQIISLNEEGKSLDEICRLLAVNNIKTMQDKKWYPTTIKRLIDRYRKD